ncbi:MAG: dihydroorotase [Robiginitomaculum sp.]
MHKLAIKNARLIDPQTGLDEIGDLFIENGHISTMGPDIFNEGLSPDITVIDADGLALIPGLIDIRVVTSEPGAEHKETLESAGKAAASGGVTTMVVMPQTNPVIDDISLVDYILKRGRQTSSVKVLSAGALTKGLLGTEMTELGMMSEAGAVMFSNGETPIKDTRLMHRIMAYSSAFNALISCRIFDIDLSKNTCAHESDLSSRMGLAGAPAVSERIMAERDLALAELTGARTLLDLVSAAQTLPPIRRAKAKDLDIAASVSINHLALNELDIGDYRSFAKLDPPLRSEDDRQALLAAINEGTIDIIVSAHDPRPAGEKRRPFSEASAGAVGLELLLSAGLTLVADGQLDLMAYLKAVTCNPAALLDLPQGKLAIGAPADLVLLDLGAPWVCDVDKLISLSRNTPFDKRSMQGKAIVTICDGKIVFDTRT